MQTYTLKDTSTIYMDGSAVYEVRRADKPGILFSIRTWPLDAEKLAALLDSQTEEAKA
jgi:hypothetical protein